MPGDRRRYWSTPRRARRRGRCGRGAPRCRRRRRRGRACDRAPGRRADTGPRGVGVGARDTDPRGVGVGARETDRRAPRPRRAASSAADAAGDREGTPAPPRARGVDLAPAARRVGSPPAEAQPADRDATDATRAAGRGGRGARRGSDSRRAESEPAPARKRKTARGSGPARASAPMPSGAASPAPGRVSPHRRRSVWRVRALTRARASRTRGAESAREGEAARRAAGVSLPAAEPGAPPRRRLEGIERERTGGGTRRPSSFPGPGNGDVSRRGGAVRFGRNRSATLPDARSEDATGRAGFPKPPKAFDDARRRAVASARLPPRVVFVFARAERRRPNPPPTASAAAPSDRASRRADGPIARRVQSEGPRRSPRSAAMERVHGARARRRWTRKASRAANVPAPPPRGKEPPPRGRNRRREGRNRRREGRNRRREGRNRRENKEASVCGDAGPGRLPRPPLSTTDDGAARRWALVEDAAGWFGSELAEPNPRGGVRRVGGPSRSPRSTRRACSSTLARGMAGRRRRRRRSTSAPTRPTPSRRRLRRRRETRGRASAFSAFSRRRGGRDDGARGDGIGRRGRGAPRAALVRGVRRDAFLDGRDDGASVDGGEAERVPRRVLRRRGKTSSASEDDGDSDADERARRRTRRARRRPPRPRRRPPRPRRLVRPRRSPPSRGTRSGRSAPR